ncbi:MAG: hypothetical protein ACK518_04740, partial [bacterium]
GLHSYRLGNDERTRGDDVNQRCRWSDKCQVPAACLLLGLLDGVRRAKSVEQLLEIRVQLFQKNCKAKK